MLVVINGKGSAMAFINEKLTPEQHEEFNSWGIKKPIFGFGQISREKDMVNPLYWTVDHEREIYLLSTTHDRDYPDESVFIFIWNKKKYLVQFNSHFEDEETVVWSVPEKYLIDSTFPYCEEEGFIDDLRDALLCYGSMGTTDENCKTVCNF